MHSQSAKTESSQAEYIQLSSLSFAEPCNRALYTYRRSSHDATAAAAAVACAMRGVMATMRVSVGLL